MTALEYLKKEHLEIFTNYDFEEFVDMLCERCYDVEYGEPDCYGEREVIYIIKVADKLIRCIFFNYKLESMCFVEEKERIVKYYEPIKD